MSRELFERLVLQAGQALGFGEIDFSRGKDCLVRIGEGVARVEIVLSYDEAVNEAVMSAKIGTLLSDRKSKCSRAFLSRHLFWGESNGATFSLDPVLRCVNLSRRDKIETTDKDLFTSRLISFMREAFRARSKLEKCEDTFGKIIDGAIDSEVENPESIPDNIADLNSLQFHV